MDLSSSSRTDFNERNSHYDHDTKFTTLLLGVAALTLTAGLARAEDQLDAETKARVERFEKGPATIDVSKYPDGIKDNYEVFSTEMHAMPQAEPAHQLRLRHCPTSGRAISNG